MNPQRRRLPPPPANPSYAHLGVIEGENELFRDRPLSPPVGLIVGGVYIPPEADDAEVVRLLEAARRLPATDQTPN